LLSCTAKKKHRAHEALLHGALLRYGSGEAARVRPEPFQHGVAPAA
jgi:hypothetical protein